jgi:micrococcal nuclease
MRNVFLISFLFMALFMSAQDTCRITRVIDGDTYELLCDSQKSILRLMNVDAPEKDQFYGQRVTDTLSQMLQGSLVTVHFQKRDFYGRNLGQIHWNEIPLDSLLIANGWAWHYHPYSKDPSLADVQDIARSDACGLWKCSYNVPPWIWRGLNRRNKRMHSFCK